jgi:hypothetical protein
MFSIESAKVSLKNKEVPAQDTVQRQFQFERENGDSSSSVQNR